MRPSGAPERWLRGTRGHERVLLAGNTDIVDGHRCCRAAAGGRDLEHALHLDLLPAGGADHGNELDSSRDVLADDHDPPGQLLGWSFYHKGRNFPRRACLDRSAGGTRFTRRLLVIPHSGVEGTVRHLQRCLRGRQPRRSASARPPETLMLLAISLMVSRSESAPASHRPPR